MPSQPEVRVVTPTRSSRKKFDAQYSLRGQEILRETKKAYGRGDFEEVERLALELEVIEQNCKCIFFRLGH